MDLFDTLDRLANPDRTTCLVLARYLRHQADRLERRATHLTEMARLAVKRGEARARLKRGDTPGLQKKIGIRQRNRTIIQHARRGWTNTEIADKYGLSPNYIGRLIKEGFAADSAPILERPDTLERQDRDRADDDRAEQQNRNARLNGLGS